MNKFISFIIVITLLLACCVACADTEAIIEGTTTVDSSVVVTTNITTSATTSEVIAKVDTTKEIEENPFKEFFEISWLTGFGATYEEGAYDELMLEDKYNIDLKVWNLDYNDTDGITMMIAAGDIPDVGYLCTAPKDAVALYEEGFTRSIPLDMYKKYFPYYYKQMEIHKPSSFMYNKMEDKDEYYGISFITSVWKFWYNCPVFRLDWLENIGYTVPEPELKCVHLPTEPLSKYDGNLYITDFLFDFDELNDIFRAFTEDDPDGNGEDDTYAASAFETSFTTHWADIYWGMFGLTCSNQNYLYMDKATGDVVPRFASSNFKDYIVWESDMREKGYMRTFTEIYDSKWNDLLKASWKTGKVGMFVAERQSIAVSGTAANENNIPQSLWLNGFEDAKFVVMPVLKGPSDNFGNRRYSIDAFADGKYRTMNIGANVSDEKLIRIFTLWNDAYSNPFDQFMVDVYKGIEGVHFTWSGEPWNSSMVWTETTKIPDKYRRAKFFKGWWFEADSVIMGNNDTAFFQLEQFFDESNWAEKYSIEPYKYINYMYMGNDMYKEYIEEYSEIESVINVVVQDFMKRSWEGNIANINTEWEQYINQLYAAGLETIINKYYNNEDFKKYQKPTEFNYFVYMN